MLPVRTAWMAPPYPCACPWACFSLYGRLQSRVTLLTPSGAPLRLAPHFPFPYLPPPPPLQYGWTALHMAAMRDRAPVVALLLATPGVDPLAKSKGVRDTQRRLRGLPVPRPSPLLQPADGETPLDWARRYGKPAAAALLRVDPRVAAALAAAGEA